MSAKFGVADDAFRLQIHRRRRFTVAHRRKMVSTCVTATMIIPVLPTSKDVVQVLLADHAKCTEHFMLERLNHPLYKSLEVG